jgi:hypothetical protein
MNIPNKINFINMYPIKLIFLTFITLKVISEINTLNAQNLKSNIGIIKHLGISDNNLLGEFSKNVAYKPINLKVKVPNDFPNKKNIPYDKLLMSGLNSMLLEYKNYYGDITTSAYILFALGNYSVMNEDILSLINKKIFTNQTLLKKIYNWAKPYYQNIFNELTFNEQQLILNKVLLAENYLQLVIIEKNITKYNNWLDKIGIENDEKIIGFFKRRLIKKQWSIEDCKFWIDQIKHELPALKNKNDKASHLQITEQINWNLNIATNDSGYYFLTDRYYEKLSSAYEYIEFSKGADNQIINLHKSLESDVYKYYVNEMEELIKPLNPEWKDWNYLNDTIICYKMNRSDTMLYPESDSKYVVNITINGIYNLDKNKEVLTNFYIMLPLASLDLIVAGNDTSCKIYNYNGQLISNEDVELIGASSTGADGSTAMVYWVDVKAIHHNKWLIIRNKNYRYGLLRNDGSLLLPFNYFSISRSSIENEIIVVENEDGKEIVYSVIDDKIQLKD